MNNNNKNEIIGFMKFLIMIFRFPISFLTYNSYKINSDRIDYIYSKYEYNSIKEHCGNLYFFNFSKKVHKEGCILNLKIKEDYKEY